MSSFFSMPTATDASSSSVDDPHSLLSTIYLDEIEALVARPALEELVFVNRPSACGDYQLDVNIFAVNTGPQRLDPRKRQNAPHLEIEARLHEIRSHIQLWPDSTAERREYLDDRIFAALGELDLRKALLWWKQRRPITEGTVITDHLSHVEIPAHPHIAGAFLTVAALASRVSRSQLRLILAGYRDGAPSPEIASQIPKDPRTVLHRLQLGPVCDNYVVCPRCWSLYALTDETSVPPRCTHKATQRSASCDESLWRQKRNRRVPRRIFRQQNFEIWLARLLNRPDIEPLLENAYRRPKQDPMVSDWDGDRYSRICDMEGHPFLPGPDSETRLVFSWSHDGWNPYYNKAASIQYSCTSFWLVCMTLPESIRYLEENVYYLGSLPGKPAQEEINPVLSIIVRIFTKFYAGVWFSRTSRHRHGRHVKAIVVPQISDALATRQGAGYSVLTSRRLCIFCKIEHDDIECFDRDAWPQRDSLMQREIVQSWENARTEAERKTIFKEHGLNHTPFHALPYYEPLLDNLPDPDHLGLQGLGKELVLSCFGINFGAPRLLRCRTYTRPEEGKLKLLYERLIDAIDEQKRNDLIRKISGNSTKAGTAWHLSWELDLRLVGSKKVMAGRIVHWREEATDADVQLLREKVSSWDEEDVLVGRPPFKSNKARALEHPTLPEVVLPTDVEMVAVEEEQDAIEPLEDVEADEVRGATGNAIDDDDIGDESDPEERSTVASQDTDSIIATSDGERSVESAQDASEAEDPDASRAAAAKAAARAAAKDKAAMKRKVKKEAELRVLMGTPDAVACAGLLLERQPRKVYKQVKKQLLQCLCFARNLPWEGKKADLLDRLQDWVEVAWFEPELEPTLDTVLGEARDVLDLPTMQFVWLEMALTILPSFMNGAPANWGTKTRGKLSSDEYFVLITVHLPISLIQLWGTFPETERRRQLLDHLMHLVDIGFTLFSDTVSRQESHDLDDSMVQYMENKKRLFKDVTVKVNDHTALHYGDVLRNFGPTPSHDGSYYERFIRSLHNININMKPSELESTLMESAVRQSNVWALLVQRAELLEHMPHFVEEYNKQADADPRGTRLGNLQLKIDRSSTDDGAVYLRSASRPHVLSLPLYSLVVAMRSVQPSFGSAPTAVARDALEVGRVAIGGAPFTSIRTSPRNCNILYRTRSAADVEEHTAGSIEFMAVHTHGGASSLLIFIRPYNPIPMEKRYLDEPFRRYKRGGFCCLTSFAPLVVIDASSVICNVAATPKRIDGENLVHFAPVGQLARRLTPSYTYDPLSNETG